MGMKVVIYSTPTCHFCDKAKEFFKQNGVKFSEINVKEDVVARKKMIEMSGQMGVPVITIDDQVVTGFDAYALKTFLKL